MAQGEAPATEDRQVEVARRYRRDGSLEAERYRARVRTSVGSYGPQNDGLTFGQVLAGVVYVVAWPVGMWWLTGSLWGAAAGLAIVTLHLAAQS